MALACRCQFAGIARGWVQDNQPGVAFLLKKDDWLSLAELGVVHWSGAPSFSALLKPFFETGVLGLVHPLFQA